MALETKIELNPSTIEGVKDLIQDNAESARTLSRAAHGVGDNQVARLCVGLREQRRRHEGELKFYILINGEPSTNRRSWVSSIRQDWFSFRALVSRGNPKLVLQEVERRENGLKDAYEEVIRRTAGSAMNDVLCRQYHILKEGLERVRQMRREWNGKAVEWAVGISAAAARR